MRVLALVVVGAMLVMMLISFAASTGHSETLGRDTYSMDITFHEDKQALLVTQRLTYTNRTGDALDRVMFAVYANMFRRESTVMYEDASALPFGYQSGGVEFTSVTVNGAEADWGLEGDGEYFLRVACDLAPGASCEFGFTYAVLVTENAAFLGAGATDWRFSGFYPVTCVYTDGIWEANTPVQQSRYTYTYAADYRVTVTLPGEYQLAATGLESRSDNKDGTATWAVQADGIREFSMSVGRAWRAYTDTTDSGVAISVYTSSRAGGPRALQIAKETVELYEKWFGEFPVKQIDIAESAYALNRLSFSGAVWISSDLFDSASRDELTYQLRFALAEQYFGLAVYADPLADSWMCTSICEYVTYLAVEETDGYDAFVKRLNGRVVDALQVTVPGDLYVTADASKFNQAEYNTVVRDRGAAVMHETRKVMGRDEFIASLARYYADNRDKQVVVETDLVAAMDAATGGDWKAFLTDTLFTIGDYADEQIDWYE